MRRVLTVVCLVASPALAGGQEREPLERSFAVSGEPEIRVRNEDGRIQIVSGADGTVRVRVTKEVRHARDEADADRAAGEVEVRIEQREGRIYVEALHPEGRWTRRRRAEVLVHVEIEAPRRSHLDVSGEDGPVRVEGFDGRVRVVLEDGDLRLTDVSGTIDVEAEDGDLRLENVRGDLSARLEDGDLELTGILHGLRVETEDGEIDVRLEAGSRMERDWSLEAEDGGIRLSLPEGFAASLDVRVGDGRISMDDRAAADVERSERRLSAALNGGGPTLRVRADDGSVRIRN